MRTLLLGLIAFTALLLPRKIEAQQFQRGGEFDSCLRPFFDPSTYNWYSVENNCDERLSVTICAADGGCGTFTISPGGHNSNGLTRREVESHGGMWIYGCRPGYIPVDASDNYVSRGPTRYNCRRI